jgi:hypothetical protein
MGKAQEAARVAPRSGLLLLSLSTLHDSRQATDPGCSATRVACALSLMAG